MRTGDRYRSRNLKRCRWLAWRGIASFGVCVLATLLGGCRFATPGSSTPPKQLQEQQYFSHASELQSAATKCPTTSCKDAELTAAVKVYERILHLDPFNKFAYYDIGVIYTQSGQTKAASTAFQKSLLIDPNYYPALYNLAYLDATSNDVTDAIALYEQAAVVKSVSNPDRAKAYFNLGYLYDVNGKRINGDAAFAEAVTLDPSLRARIPAKFFPPGLRAATKSTAMPS